MMKLKAPAPVAETIRGLHPNLKKKIRAGLEAILKDPEAGKALKQELSGLRSFRVGRYRIVYKFEGRATLEIVAVGPRKVIYTETYLLLRKSKE